MPDPVEVAAKYAGQSDRWILNFILILGFAGVVFICRWLINGAEKRSAITEERLERQTKLLADLFHEANTSRERIAGVIADNTNHVCASVEIMKDNTEMLRRQDQVLEKACLLLERLKDR